MSAIVQGSARADAAKRGKRNSIMLVSSSTKKTEIPEINNSLEFLCF